MYIRGGRGTKIFVRSAVPWYWPTLRYADLKFQLRFYLVKASLHGAVSSAVCSSAVPTFSSQVPTSDVHFVQKKHVLDDCSMMLT